MANKEHLEILKQGVAVWNKWRKDNPNIISPDLSKANLLLADLQFADLRRADLSDANLSKAYLNKAILRKICLNEAYLSGADFSSANLIGSDLSHVDASGAIFSGADLKEADFREADIRRSNLRGSDLSNANITGAILYLTIRDYWKIRNIRCDYIFWDLGDRKRTPKDRNFNPGEFEQLYKWRPLNDFERLIERSIEFPPEYKQAGVSILNYFSEILRKKYPESNATVQIKQNGLRVIMTIDPAEGERQTFEEELNRFGLVTTGKITPEEYAGNNPLLLIELKSELRSAYNKIELQKELIHYQERELKKSDIQIERFLNILEKGITPDITVSPTIIVSPKIKGDESSIKARNITDSKLAAGNDIAFPS
jgi:hypothetical protein